MIRYNFTNVSREQLANIAINAIKALADNRNFDTFNFTLDIDVKQEIPKLVMAMPTGNTGPSTGREVKEKTQP